MFALIDCNNFFVSCERIFEPGLSQKPVVVLSNNDGCVVSRSNEAKMLGVPMGVPFFKIKTMCVEKNIRVFSSNYQLYGDFSKRVMRILRDSVPRVEVYSIDEAFVDLTGIENSYEFARQLHDRILKWVGIPVSIGIGRTKTLAKVAADIAKKNPHNRGVFVLEDEPLEKAVLAHMPIEEIWGIGRRWSKTLQSKYKISTALELRQLDPIMIRKSLSVIAERVVMELRGISCLILEELQSPQKTMVCSRSFGTKTTSLKEVRESLAQHASQAGEKLRAHGLVATGILVFIRSSYFSKNSEPFTASAYKGLPFPTSSTLRLIQATEQALQECFQPGVLYAKTGVFLMELHSVQQIQFPLFGEVDLADAIRKESRLMSVVDGINQRYGKRVVVSAAVGGEKRPWQMRSETRSHRFTTQWDELKKVS